MAPDAVFLLSGAKQQEVMVRIAKELNSEHFQSHVIGIIPARSSSLVLNLLQAGLTEVLIPPLDPEEVVASFWQCVDKGREQSALKTLKQKFAIHGIIGESRVLMAELEKLIRYAHLPQSVFITGERGTGKNVFARLIHFLSPRSEAPFVTVNCATLKAELFESQMFGHVAGAFTGANHDSPGLFREGHRGVIFMDELEGLPDHPQIRLLNVLQEKEFLPLGSAKRCSVDVRVIAATNMEIGEALKTGQLRADLYDRLNVFPLHLPPLRERVGDVALLAQHFLGKCEQVPGRQIIGFTREAMLLLETFSWPGNVRELQTVILRTVANSRGPLIKPEEIALPRKATPHEAFQTRKAKAIWNFEDEAIKTALMQSRGSLTRAAAAEQMNVRAFRRMARDHGIMPQRSCRA